MQSYFWSDGVYRSVPEYQGCRHYGVDTCGAGDGKQILPRTGIPCAVAKPDACPQLYDVRALGEAICDMEKYIPDESSMLGEKYEKVVEKYNKVSEHFI